jgi:tRNA pseudouridine38-40 synthase
VSRAARRLRIDLAYDGTDFSGWQVQPGERTVQGVLEAALTRINGDREVRVRAAGRTDAGAHARGQVVDARLGSPLADGDIAHALGRMLPADVRALAVTTVDEDFHARYHARSKTYAYRLDRTRTGDPFRARHALHWPHRLDRAALGAALAHLPGRRDWSGFTGAACNVEERVRTLTVAEYAEPEPAAGVFTFTADGFLNYMVRNLVGTLLEIGAGRRAADEIPTILESGDRDLAGPTAPARGLCLEHVSYDIPPQREASGRGRRA